MQPPQGSDGAQGMQGSQQADSGGQQGTIAPRRNQRPHWHPTEHAVNITTAVKTISFFIFFSPSDHTLRVGGAIDQTTLHHDP